MTPETLKVGAKSGNIFETFVISEITSHIQMKVLIIVVVYFIIEGKIKQEEYVMVSILN